MWVLAVLYTLCFIAIVNYGEFTNKNSPEKRCLKMPDHGGAESLTLVIIYFQICNVNKMYILPLLLTLASIMCHSQECACMLPCGNHCTCVLLCENGTTDNFNWNITQLVTVYVSSDESKSYTVPNETSLSAYLWIILNLPMIPLVILIKRRKKTCPSLPSSRIKVIEIMYMSKSHH